MYYQGFMVQRCRTGPSPPGSGELRGFLQVVRNLYRMSLTGTRKTGTRPLWQYFWVDWTKTKKLVQDEFPTIDFASFAKGVKNRKGQVARLLPWSLLTRSFLAALR